jgi:DNA repair protein RadD
MQLRGYQEDGLERARQCFAQGKRSVLMVAPTGSGKTVMIAEAARKHRAKQGQVVCLAHRVELIKQTIDKLWKAGLTDIGAITAEGSFNERAPVVVASIQTLLARGQRPAASLLIPDEAHHYLSAEWSKVAGAYANVPTLGFTATPQRADGTGLDGMFDALVEVATTRELVAAGHLVPIETFAPARRLEGSELMNPVQSLERHAPDKRAVIFAASVGHGRMLAGQCGDRAGYVDGKTRQDERSAILRRFEEGRITRLVNVFVLTEGWDCPIAEVCVIARGCSAASTFLQMVGRVRRPSPGKLSCLLIDCKGAVHMHGMPDDDRTYSLVGRPIRVAESLPPIRQCPECGAVDRPAQSCSRCGYEYPKPEPVTEKEGELTRVDNVTPESSKRSFLRAQLRLALERGHKPGAAAHKFKWRFGHWPPRNWITEERA